MQLCEPIVGFYYKSCHIQVFDCAGRAVGIYEHPDQCNWYYTCGADGRVGEWHLLWGIRLC